MDVALHQQSLLFTDEAGSRLQHHIADTPFQSFRPCQAEPPAACNAGTLAREDLVEQAGQALRVQLRKYLEKSLAVQLPAPCQVDESGIGIDTSVIAPCQHGKTNAAVIEPPERMQESLDGSKGSAGTGR